MGLASGSPDDRSRVQALLAEVVARHGRKAPPTVCFVGEAPAVREAVREVFGQSVIVQRCPWEKRRRILDRLPAPMQAGVLEELLAAYALSDARAARRGLDQVARSLEETHPEAAATLREGIEETLSLHKLGGESRGAKKAVGSRATAPTARARG